MLHCLCLLCLRECVFSMLSVCVFLFVLYCVMLYGLLYFVCFPTRICSVGRTIEESTHQGKMYDL